VEQKKTCANGLKRKNKEKVLCHRLPGYADSFSVPAAFVVPVVAVGTGCPYADGLLRDMSCSNPALMALPKCRRHNAWLSARCLFPVVTWRSLIVNLQR
jgi:hypothetical protein